MNKTLVNLVQKVNAADITIKDIDGDKHYVIPSATLPDNIVMNGGLYPSDEIEKGYKSLEGVPAPASHPKINGQYVSARDVRAINKFHVGGYVANVKREGGRVYHDTIINERVALQTEQGKKLIDAINKKEPIHTSTGVFLQQEPTDGEMTANEGPSKGKPYTWIARNLVHDHNAILLNEQGAATPQEGVGMMVNSSGDDEDFKVMFVNLDDSDTNKPKTAALIFSNDEDELGFFHKLAKKLGFNVKSTSKHNESEGDEMKLIKDKLVELGVNHEGLSDTDTLALYNKSILAEVKPEVNTLTAADVAKIVTDTLVANEATKAKSDKEALVALIIANTKYTEEDKEMLLNTDSRLLNSFLPQPRAAGLGHPAPLQANESSIANDTMPE